MSLADHAKRSYQIKYTRIYLNPRLPDNTYAGWINITKHLRETNIGQLKKSIDSDDFDIGFYEESNIKIRFDNLSADFSEDRGYFEGKVIDRSRVKIVAGYQSTEEPGNLTLAEYETSFEGIIDDRATQFDADKEEVSFQILSYSSILRTLRSDPGAVTNGQSFSDSLYNLLNRTEITQLLTVDAANINPQLDQTIDTASWFTGKQLNTAINQLLVASNSILRIKDNTIYISGRTESATVRFQFFGKGSAKPSNVISIKKLHSGLKRTFTRVNVGSISSEATDELIDLYGAHEKNVDFGFMSDEAKLEAIADDILAEFQYPKKELEITTDYLGNEVDILDMVTIDNKGTLIDRLPPLYGTAVYGTSKYPRRQGGVKLDPLEGFKVLSITHNFKNYTSSLKVRSVGNQPFDSNAGYRNPIYGQAVYGLSLYATT